MKEQLNALKIKLQRERIKAINKQREIKQLQDKNKRLRMRLKK